MKPQYFAQCADEYLDYWHLVGDHLGQPAETRWKVVATKCSSGMGPFQWFHQYYRLGLIVIAGFILPRGVHHLKRKAMNVL